jgi:hypothetical protein
MKTLALSFGVLNLITAAAIMCANLPHEPPNSAVVTLITGWGLTILAALK